MKNIKIAIIGSGPAGLIAADMLSQAGFEVEVFEKNKGTGFKLLIAGSSGLNIGNHFSSADFIEKLSGPKKHFQLIFKNFFTQDWKKYLEQLGLEVFLGSSGKYFVKEMKSAKLLNFWLERIKVQGVKVHCNSELVKLRWNVRQEKWILNFLHSNEMKFDGVFLALGGGSWLKEPAQWPDLFSEYSLKILPFEPSNCGYEVLWPKGLLEEAEGGVLKNILLQTKKGQLQGDLVITKYGVEGTPVYFYGTPGKCTVDLFPQLTEDQIQKKCKKIKENLSPLRKLKKALGLPRSINSFIFYLVPEEFHQDLSKLIHLIKNIPLTLLNPRPLSEAISSKGGISFSELDDHLMLKKCPGVFCAGEMLDWDAPTGGYLVQTCVSQGVFAAQGMKKYFKSKTE